MWKRLRSKTYPGGLFVLFVLLFQASCALAEEYVRPALKFTAGVATAFLVHEGAHALTAGLAETDMSWRLGDVNQPPTYTEHARSQEKGLVIGSAGLLAQVAGSEVILGIDKIDKNDAFVRGVMAWDILNPLSYVVDYWLIRRTNKRDGNACKGDLQGVEHYSTKPTADAVALSMAAIAAFQGYRFVKTQSWAPEWLKGRPDRLALQRLPHGGLAIAYQYRF